MNKLTLVRRLVLMGLLRLASIIIQYLLPEIEITFSYEESDNTDKAQPFVKWPIE